MEGTLRRKIEKMLNDLVFRQQILDNNIKQYVEAGNLGDAAINQIKHQTLETVRIRLVEALAD